MATNLPCFRFRNTGSCPYGSNCIYIHVEKAAGLPVNAPAADPVPAPGPGREAIAVPNPIETAAATAPAPTPTLAPSNSSSRPAPKLPCFRFQATGSCRYGLQCIYSHDIEPSNAPPAPTLPCFRFQATGVCRLGSRCVYRHDKQPKAVVPPRQPVGTVKATPARIPAPALSTATALLVDPALERGCAPLPAIKQEPIPTAKRKRSESPDGAALPFPKHPKPAPSLTPLDDFFASYVGFHYDPAASATKAFGDLCRWARWAWDNPEKQVAHAAFQDALVQQFNRTYGTEADSLRAWQALAHVVGLAPIPETLEACRAAVADVHVNIVDLVDARKDPHAVVHKFKTELELSNYTRNYEKFFPRENAYAGGILKHLLRNILNPSATRGRRPPRRR